MYYKPEFVVGFYFKMNDRPEDMSFHYTDETMVKDLLKITPIEQNDTVLDPCSGLNKVWYNNFNVKEKYECEIEDGNNFFDWELSTYSQDNKVYNSRKLKETIIQENW